MVCIVIWVFVAGATVIGTITDNYGLNVPFFFVMPVDQEIKIQTLTSSLVMLGLIFINSSIVMTKLYLHDRFFFLLRSILF